MVTEVTVEVHEKRNHPFEYGHYDCSARVTAKVEPEDSVDVTLFALRKQARFHVKQECDEWENGLREQNRLEHLRGSINSRMNSLRWAASEERVDELYAETMELIHQLPECEHAELRTKLVVWVQSCIQRLEESYDDCDDEDDGVIPY